MSARRSTAVVCCSPFVQSGEIVEHLMLALANSVPVVDNGAAVLFWCVVLASCPASLASVREHLRRISLLILRPMYPTS